MVPGDMYEWSRVIFAKKSKFHDAGGPDTVVSPNITLVTQSTVGGVGGHSPHHLEFLHPMVVPPL